MERPYHVSNEIVHDYLRSCLRNDVQRRGSLNTSEESTNRIVSFGEQKTEVYDIQNLKNWF